MTKSAHSAINDTMRTHFHVLSGGNFFASKNYFYIQEPLLYLVNMKDIMKSEVR